jgi:hypothetical protein
LKNDDILDNIYHNNTNLNNPIKLTKKVKAHTGLPLNELADLNAKAARVLPPTDSLYYPNETPFPFRFSIVYSNNERLGVYAATYIKFSHHETLGAETGEYITARFKKYFVKDLIEVLFEMKDK